MQVVRGDDECFSGRTRCLICGATPGKWLVTARDKHLAYPRTTTENLVYGTYLALCADCYQRKRVIFWHFSGEAAYLKQELDYRMWNGILGVYPTGHINKGGATNEKMTPQTIRVVTTEGKAEALYFAGLHIAVEITTDTAGHLAATYRYGDAWENASFGVPELRRDSSHDF